MELFPQFADKDSVIFNMLVQLFPGFIIHHEIGPSFSLGIRMKHNLCRVNQMTVTKKMTYVHFT